MAHLKIETLQVGEMVLHNMKVFFLLNNICCSSNSSRSDVAIHNTFRSFWLQNLQSTACYFLVKQIWSSPSWRTVKTNASITYTPEVSQPTPENGWLEDYFSYWEGNFSGAMLNFGVVYI